MAMRKVSFMTASRWLANPIRGFRKLAMRKPVSNPNQNKMAPAIIMFFCGVDAIVIRCLHIKIPHGGFSHYLLCASPAAPGTCSKIQSNRC